MVIFALLMFIKPILCPLILGLFAIFIAVASIRFMKTIHIKGIDCTGTIVEYQSDNEGYKTPVIEFTSMTGEVIREKPFIYASSDLSKVRTYKNLIKQQVSILYDPEDPKKFILKEEETFSYLFLMILIAIGLFFIGMSIASLLGYIKMD